MEGGLDVAAFICDAHLLCLFLGCTKPLSLSAAPASGVAAAGVVVASGQAARQPQPTKAAA